MPHSTNQAFIALLLASFLILASAHSRHAISKEPVRPQPTVANWSSVVYLSPYEPKVPKSLDEIPAPVRGKLRAHLLERLGEKYLSRLTFAGGQIVDIDELYRVDPSARDFKWTIFSYRLSFRVTAPEKGILEYFAEIELDKAGNVIKEITLPPVRRLPLKRDFVPLSQAYSIAAKNGFAPNHIRAEIDYDKEVESIFYHLAQTIKESYGRQTDRTIDIDAHSGNMLRLGKAEWLE